MSWKESSPYSDPNTTESFMIYLDLQMVKIALFFLWIISKLLLTNIYF